MTTASAGRPPRPRRPRLSLPVVVAGAVALVEREGPHALSMRRLGRELGVEAMSLYRYLPSFDDLLNAVVDQVVNEMLDRPDMQALPEDDWRAFLTRQAHGVRSIAVARPAVFPLIATHPPAAPWIRPPVRSLRWIEEFLAGLLARGFADEGAAAAYRTFTSFLLGNLLLEVGSRGVDTGPVEERANNAEKNTNPQQAAALTADYPAVSRLAGHLMQDHAEREFQAELTGLLDRIEHLNGLPSPSALG